MGKDAWTLLSCDFWRDGGSYSATLQGPDRVVSVWLQVARWDRPEARRYEALFVSDGTDATVKTQRVAAGADEKQWLKTLEEARVGSNDEHVVALVQELIEELRILSARS